MRKIIHIDMDCFFAAVEMKYRPELKGKPVAVGGPAHSRGVISTSNYEARRFGVRSAMPSGRALKLCPQLILVPPQFELYKTESRAVRAILERYTPHIEPLSLDEAYLDVTLSQQCSGSATLMAKEIRSAIFQERELTASAGVAENKFLAKLASDWNKPNGQFVIRPEDVPALMPTIPIERIWGVGRVTAQHMHKLGLNTCGDIQKQSLLQLTRWFGSRAKDLFDLSRGIDVRPVREREARKSLTVEETFSTDLGSLTECQDRIPDLYQDWERRMMRVKDRYEVKGHVVKLKFFDFKTTTHENSLKRWPTINDFIQLLGTAWSRRAVPVRLIGIGVRLQAPDFAADAGDQLAFELG